MKNKMPISIVVILCAFVYNFIFWGEQFGINLLIFNSLISSLIFIYFKDARHNKYAIWTALGTTLVAIMVVLNNSLLSRFIYFLSLISFVGFAQQKELKSLLFAFQSGLLNIGISTIKMRSILDNSQKFPIHFPAMIRSFRLTIVPLLIVLLFYAVYYNANPNFAHLSDGFWNSFLLIFDWDISFWRVVFFIIGFFLIGGILWKYEFEYLNISQRKKKLDLIRIRKKTKPTDSNFSLIGLKNEYQMGIGLVISLNALLLIINTLDIFNVWFGEINANPLALKDQVHEGTYLLILAILMAMAVLIILFRKNINFLPNNGFLKSLGYLWLFQNSFLAITLLITNFRYIDYCGLAYKRIGVMIFLMLTFYGIWTLFIKIRQKKTFHFLMNKNAWAVYFVLILTTFVNWDVMITRYNLNTNQEFAIDVGFLLYDVSDKNLFLLEENIDKLKKRGNFSEYYGKLNLRKEIEKKRQKFEKRQEKLSWLSWNFQDFRNKKITKE